jgi:hypothetical protein
MRLRVMRGLLQIILSILRIALFIFYFREAHRAQLRGVRRVLQLYVLVQRALRPVLLLAAHALVVALDLGRIAPEPFCVLRSLFRRLRRHLRPNVLRQVLQMQRR